MTAACGWTLEVHEAVTSTSDVLAARAAAGAPDGLAVLARRQTQGRGRAGRAWESPDGNLALSVLLRPMEPASRAGEWPLLTGVALADVIQSLLPDPAALSLKWPNDVLVDGAKLAGVLIETTLDAAGMVATMVVGVGVNLAAAPRLPDRATACLGHHVAAPPAPEAFAALLLDALWRRRAERARDGFAPIRAAWLAAAHPIGTGLTVAGTFGHFAGLADDGALLLETANCLRRIASGDVWLTDPDPR